MLHLGGEKNQTMLKALKGINVKPVKKTGPSPNEQIIWGVAADLAMVPRLTMSSFFVMSLLETSMLIVELVSSGIIVMNKFGWFSISSGSVIDW